jgi:poly(A) polymerase
VALTIDAAKWRRRRGMRRLIDALDADEGLTRYVGGAVRDDLLHAPINDIDLATRLQPDEVIKRLETARIKAVPTGIDHGTITAVSDGHAYEVTTLREDVETDGRRATISFTNDWKQDAARRDFTINALSADPRTGEVFDYFGGLADLVNHHVRFIGNPLTRIAEDHLRILRYFRFHARFGAGAPDEAAINACSERANDLMALSRERIADELMKLLALPDPTTTMALMVARGILRPVLPEIDDRGVSALAQLIANEKAADVKPESLRRLSALLPRQPDIAQSVAARLKLSNKARKRLACGATTNLDLSPQALAYRVGTQCAVDRLLFEGRSVDAKHIEGWTPPRLPISGGDLIARGLAKGPIVARTLRAIDDRWVAAGFPDGAAFEAIVGQVLEQAR